MTFDIDVDLNFKLCGFLKKNPRKQDTVKAARVDITKFYHLHAIDLYAIMN